MEIKISKISHADKTPMDLLLEADPSEEMIKRYLHSGDCYLVKSKGEVVGVFVLMPNSAQEIELRNIAVHRKYRGQGIGKEIMKYVVRISKLDGFDFLITKTADTSVGQQEFYRKMKFEPYFTVKGHFIKYYPEPIIENGQQAVDQVVLRRKL